MTAKTAGAIRKNLDAAFQRLNVSIGDFDEAHAFLAVTKRIPI